MKDESSSDRIWEARNIRRLLAEVIRTAGQCVEAYPLRNLKRTMTGRNPSHHGMGPTISPRLRLENAVSDACWLLSPEKPERITRTFTLYECCEIIGISPQVAVPARTARKAREICRRYMKAINKLKKHAEAKKEKA